jgi:amidophosphoribosyltransferase
MSSVVRGTTTKEIIKYLKEVGKAKEIHLRISCPPIRGPCFYGIDMSTISELLVPKYEGKPISGDVSPEILKKIAKDVGADSLQYQTIQGLIDAIGVPEEGLCTACITGKYPTPWGRKLYAKSWENHRKGVKGRTYGCG